MSVGCEALQRNSKLIYSSQLTEHEWNGRLIGKAQNETFIVHHPTMTDLLSLQHPPCRPLLLQYPNLPKCQMVSKTACASVRRSRRTRYAPYQRTRYTSLSETYLTLRWLHQSSRSH